MDSGKQHARRLANQVHPSPITVALDHVDTDAKLEQENSPSCIRVTQICHVIYFKQANICIRTLAYRVATRSYQASGGC